HFGIGASIRTVHQGRVVELTVEYPDLIALNFNSGEDSRSCDDRDAIFASQTRKGTVVDSRCGLGLHPEDRVFEAVFSVRLEEVLKKTPEVTQDKTDHGEFDRFSSINE